MTPRYRGIKDMTSSRVASNPLEGLKVWPNAGSLRCCLTGGIPQSLNPRRLGFTSFGMTRVFGNMGGRSGEPPHMLPVN
jgi:hypothetical protein